MKISAKLDYACRALLELSLHWPNAEALSIALISRRQKIPLKFLTQILLSLKQMGVVDSTRGQAGGYLLTQAPREIRLADVLKHFEDWKHLSAKNHELHTIAEVWAQMDETVLNFANKITFEDLLLKERNLQKVPSYTI